MVELFAMEYAVKFTDGGVVEVLVFRECTEDEARARVEVFYPGRKIKDVTIKPDHGANTGSAKQT